MEIYEYRVRTHGDLLEMHECKFIEEKLPCYEEIWKRFIGHQGNGVMAEMEGITPELDSLRVTFAQHHYTILESLILMRQVVDNPLLSQPVDTIEQYYEILNLIMAYQAHAGRVRDNIEKCYNSIGKCHEWSEKRSKLDEFWETRHIFIHGSKVPFMLDEDKLFRSAEVCTSENKEYGYSIDSSWRSITSTKMRLIYDQFSESHRALVIAVNEMLCDILKYVKAFIELNALSLMGPSLAQYQQSAISGSMGNQGQMGLDEKDNSFNTASGQPFS